MDRKAKMPYVTFLLGLSLFMGPQVSFAPYLKTSVFEPYALSGEKGLSEEEIEKLQACVKGILKPLFIQAVLVGVNAIFVYRQSVIDDFKAMVVNVLNEAFKTHYIPLKQTAKSIINADPLCLREQSLY